MRLFVILILLSILTPPSQQQQESYPVYIPVTATAPFPAFIRNGSGELGDNGDWQIVSNSGRSVFCDASAELAPRTGSRSFCLGGVNNEDVTITQLFTIPHVDSDQLIFLEFYYSIRSGEYTLNDMASISGYTAYTYNYPLSWYSCCSGWLQSRLEMSAYAGKTVSFTVRVVTDEQEPSMFYLDDIGLVVRAR